MTNPAAIQEIERAAAEQWEEMDLSGIELCNRLTPLY
jgi:hypothetical protein